MSQSLPELEKKLAELDRNGDHSEKRVDLLIQIAEHLVSGDNPQRMVDVTNEARRLSEALSYREGEAYSLLYTSTACCFLAQHEEGLQTIARSKSLFETLDNTDGVAKTTLMEANLLRSIGRFDEALDGFYKALNLFRENGDGEWEAGCLYDIGLLYNDVRDHEKARDNFQACIQITEGQPDSWLLGRSLGGLGTTLRAMGEYDQALEYSHRSLSIFQRMGHRMGEARALDDIGTTYYDAGDPAMALKFHEKSLEIRRSIGQKRAEATSLLHIARVHLDREDVKTAFAVLDSALAIATETRAKQQIYNAHQLLSRAHELAGDYDKALAHHKDYQRIREEVFNDQSTDRMNKLQIGFEVRAAEKEAEIERLKNVELHEKNERLEQLLAELRQAQGQLVQAERLAAIGKIVAGLVHEINTPLGASNSAIDVADRCIQKMVHLKDTSDSFVELCASGKLQAFLDRVQENHRITIEANERITKILTNLKSFIRLDSNERQQVDIHEGLETTLALLEHEWKDRIEIARNYGAIPPVNGYPGEINQVFMTILANAMEAIIGRGNISLQTSSANGNVRIEIADTGTGISAERLEHLFDPDFTVKGKRVKAGMGLMASLNIVKKHGGRIDVSSEVGEGTTFAIELPA
jgi:signal transduction histidine kinase